MPSSLLPPLFSTLGSLVLASVVTLSLLACVLAIVSWRQGRPLPQRRGANIVFAANFLLLMGFCLICWFHLRIYQRLPLDLSGPTLTWLNDQLAAINAQAAYSLPLLAPDRPPRYLIPLWIENEKYYFWLMCYSWMAWIGVRRTDNRRLQVALVVLLGLQAALVSWLANPFRDPLPKFFGEIGPWFQGGLTPMQQVGVFMRLYPKMVFYYNTPYMWLHPPMLFLSYSAITVTCLTSSFMLVRRDPEVERLGYDYAKFGYFMLTLGMLLGYPWALQAWGPNWWWDPKICASIMMWAIYSTYLHTRLFANKTAMWYFTSVLGIVCFLAMVFTFAASFFFPGEHTFQ